MFQGISGDLIIDIFPQVVLSIYKPAPPFILKRSLKVAETFFLLRIRKSDLLEYIFLFLYWSCSDFYRNGKPNNILSKCFYKLYFSYSPDEKDPDGNIWMGKVRMGNVWLESVRVDNFWLPHFSPHWASFQHTGHLFTTLGIFSPH